MNSPRGEREQRDRGRLHHGARLESIDSRPSQRARTSLGPARPRVSQLDSFPRGTRAEQTYQIAAPGEGNKRSLNACTPAAGVSPGQPRVPAVAQKIAKGQRAPFDSVRPRVPPPDAFPCGTHTEKNSPTLSRGLSRKEHLSPFAKGANLTRPARPRVSPLDSFPRGIRAEQTCQSAIP